MRAHLCSWACRLRCWLQLHERDDLEGKCRCCHRKPYGREAVQAEGRSYDHLTTAWWADKEE